MLKPVAKVGNFVQVVGKVRVYSSRQIVVDRIGLSMNITSWLPLTELLLAETCSSPNDELLHTRTVRRLHRTSYSLSDPFVIPPRTCQSAFTTPTKNRVMVIQTPSTIRSSPPSSISTSPVKSESLEHVHKVRLHSTERIAILSRLSSSHLPNYAILLGFTRKISLQIHFKFMSNIIWIMLP